MKKTVLMIAFIGLLFVTQMNGLVPHGNSKAEIFTKDNISLTSIQITEYKNNIPYISMFRKSANTIGYSGASRDFRLSFSDHVAVENLQHANGNLDAPASRTINNVVKLPDSYRKFNIKTINCK